MSSEDLTEDALTWSLYRLNVLYELNQEISTLRNAREVLETSLPYIIGGFGLKSGIIVIYKDGNNVPYDSVSRGLSKDHKKRWFQQLGSHVDAPYIHETCIIQDSIDSPMAILMNEHSFRVWLPIRIDESTWGGLALGNKLSDLAFTDDDLELLSTMAINIQNILSNVFLIEALNQSITKETRIRNIFQRYAPESVINEVLNPSNEQLLLGESKSVRGMFDQMIARLEEQHTLEKDLSLAHSVQEYLLPTESPEIPGLDISARSIPARGVCGDFYDFIPLGQYDLGISLGDISGKGMSAAMIATMMQSVTRMCVGNYYPIPAVLSILNRFVLQHTEADRYATMFYGQINAKERSFTYCNAGHPSTILYRNGEISFLDVGGIPVGVFDNFSYEQETIELRPDDVMVIYSDGVTDAGTTQESITFEEDAFGQERLQSLITSNASLKSNEILNAISDEVKRYTGDSKQFDDITLIVTKVE